MLFRKEALEYQKNQGTGQAILLKGLPIWVTLLGTLTFIVALISFALFGTYTRRITVNGEVITLPHTVNLFAPEQGVISRILVKDGQQVRAGTPLYEIDVSRVSPAGNVSEETVTLLKQQITETENAIKQLTINRRATLDSLQQQLEQTLKARQTSGLMVTSATDGMTAMKRSMDNYDKYRQQGLINTDQQNNQRYLYYQQQSVWHSLNSQAIQQDQQIISLRGELVTKAADFDSQLAQYRVRLSEIRRQTAEAKATGTRLISAPTEGRVSALSVTAGQMVSAGDSLAQLVPSGRPRFYLLAWLPDESVARVRSGEKLNIRYSAWPSEKYGQFSGTVFSVSSAPITERELSGYASAPRANGGSITGSWYRALIALPHETKLANGQRLQLKSGMQAQTTLFLESRPIYQWMFYPYYSLKNSLAGPKNAQE